MRVRRRDEHPFGWNPCLIGGDLLGLVQQFPSDGERINDTDRKSLRTTFKHDRTGMQAVFYRIYFPAQKLTIDDHRERFRRDVHRTSACAHLRKRFRHGGADLHIFSKNHNRA